MAATVAVRDLRADDRPTWESLWQGYLAFYRQPLPADVTDETFRRLLAREQGMFALVAADATGTAIGFSHAVVHPSTWSIETSCYLEDLYVSPAARGGDAGRLLIEATGAAGREQGAGSLYWHTQQFNGRARSLYDRVGQLTSFVKYEKQL